MPTAGEEKLIGKLWHVWVECPECGAGRWKQKASTKRSSTGLCRECYMKIARQDMKKYFPDNPNRLTY